jgi:hypothetical protein
VPALLQVGENEVIHEVSARDALARLEHVAPQIEAEVFPDCRSGWNDSTTESHDSSVQMRG